jgi:putative NIF3 family GTP cyclohydrolase 1 type 2
VGTPDHRVTRIGTGWSACTANLEAAAADGCDLFISHEPSYCEFWEPKANFRGSAWGRRRAAILERHGMAQMALHDTWDNWPVYGVRDSWLAFLGLHQPLFFRDYLGRPNQWLSMHEVRPTTVDGFAAEVAARIAALGAPAVAVMGRGEAPVRKVAVGVGCGIPTFEMLELGADLLIVVYDRAFQTFTRLPLLDLGANLLVLEHGTTEMPGMRNLARYLNETFPAIPATYYQHEPGYHLVRPAAPAQG